jgi:hypothetical protein
MAVDFQRIAEAVEGHDLNESEVEEIADEIGLVFATAGAKRQHKQYEPDNVECSLAASVPDGQTHESVSAVLQELCWETVEREQAARAEQYVREDE